MKRMILTALVGVVIFSSTSFAEWKKVSKNIDGDTWYVDFERIRKVDGYVYWWELEDHLKPDKDGDYSYKHYRQGDCKLFRRKNLSSIYYKEPMGRGTYTPHKLKNPEWNYPPPNSVNESILKKVCKYAK